MRQPRHGRMASDPWRFSVGVALIAVAVGMTACGPDAHPSEPVLTPSPDVVEWTPGTVTICKYTEAATSQSFTFKVTATGGNVPGDGRFQLNAIQELQAGQECAVVWSAIDGSTTTVTIEEVLPSGWELYLIRDDGYGAVQQTTNPYVITQYDWSDDRVIFFKNRPGEEPPPPLPCQVCQGGVTEMTLLNNGPSGEVVVKAGKKEVFRGFVASGGTFTVVGQEKDGKLGKEIKIRVDGGPETKIHTSCSQPIGPGMQFGVFEVVEAFSKDGGLICPPGEVPPCDVLCEAGKPAVLTMTLTGDDCSASSHSQAADKVSCRDFGPLAGNLQVLVTDKENPADSKAKTWFDGVVAVGSAFDIAAANAGATKLSANTWVHIYDAAGMLLQTIQFHTSCSQPLALGDQFGGLRLTGFTPEG